MKNILSKALPLLAVVLFATSCSKDDGSDNTPATPDNTVVSPDNTANTPDNTTIDLSQVVYDENGVPSIPFTITVGQDTESLSKAGVTDELKQVFDEHDKLRITGENITGELSYVKGSEVFRQSIATFKGWLSGEGVTSLTDATELKAVLYNKDYNNEGEPLSVPKEYKSTQLDQAFRECGYLTGEFNYGKYENIKLVQNTTFLKVTLEFSAKMYIVTEKGDKYTFNIPFDNATRIIAVPNGAKVSGDFMTTRTVTAPTNGVCIHKITRTRPHDKCSYGAFSISKTKQVLFCQTNIGARNNGSYCSLFFHDNPWDIEHPQNMEVGDLHADVDKWDLFGWGTWLRKQTVTKANWTDYDVNQYVWPTGTDEHATANLSESAGDWYMLTNDEWDYVLNKRIMPITTDGTSAPRFIRVTMVESYSSDKELAKGIIIFPDDYNYTDEEIATVYAQEYSTWGGRNGSYAQNTVPATKWSEKTGNGAVFLPCAGYRTGTEITYGNTSYYWTSSTMSSGTPYALSLSNSFSGATSSWGCAVRLVHDLK